MSTNGDLITWVIAQLRSNGLTPFLNVAPQNTTATPVVYPIVVVTVVSSNSTYTLNTGANRFDRFLVSIAIYDNQGQMTRTMATLDDVIEALENQHDVSIGNSVVMGTFIQNQNGPIWMQKEHYWATYIDWEIYMANSANGVMAGKLISNNSISLVTNVASITLPAFGFLPTSIVCTITKPTTADLNIYPTVVQDTIGIGGATIELSTAPDKTGYKLDWTAFN